MKRLITLLILTMVFSASMFAQTITIGTGTSTQRYPLGAFYGYERSASLYTAAEITMAGSITRLDWYATIARTSNTPIKIYIKETTSTTLTAVTWETMIAGATLCYDAVNASITANAWNQFVLSSSFGYGGSNNLLVLVEANYGGGGNGLGSAGTGVRYSTATSQHEYWQQDNTPPTGTGTVTSSRPNIQITLVTGPMTFASATTLATTTAPVLVGAINQPVIVLQVVTTGISSPFSVNSIDFTTTGTTNTSDLSAAKVFYTTSTTFSTTTQFGTVLNNPNGSFTINGTQTLASGNNYFWLCYDISTTATQWNVVDGTCTSFTTSEPQTRTPTATDPAGNRVIRLPLAGTYTIDNTLPTSGTNYISFTDACNDLNNVGTSAAVIFNVTAGQTFSKTVPAAPYNYAYIIYNYIGTSTNTVVFQKSGTGANPVLSTLGSAATNDFCFFLYGCDYVTFNSIDIADAGSSASDYLEYGYYLQGPANNNCQYVTIQNCTIDLNKNNVSTKGIYSYAATVTSAAGTNSNNTFSGNTIQDTYNGIYLSGNSTYLDENNVVSGNIIQTVGNNLATAIYPLFLTYQKNFTVSGNTINNVTGASSMYSIYSSSIDGATNQIINNTVSNITGTSTSSTVYGIYHSPLSTATANISGNTIYAMAAPYNINGLYIGAGTQNNILKNKIYNINYNGSSSYIAYGINSTGGTTNYIYNNYIYDIKSAGSTTAPGTRALSLTGGTNAYVYYNTVFIDYVSTYATGSSAALYVGAAPQLYMKDNIFVNKSDMTIGTRAVAFYKTTTALTNLDNANNNNLYFCGTLGGGAKYLIWYDGTNSKQTLADYKAWVTPRDANAMTENPPFISAVSPYNLHMQTTVNTQCESGAIVISTPLSITDDYDANPRYPNAGYPNKDGYSATAPDVGADEFAGQPLDINAPNISYALLDNTTSTANRAFTNVAITDPSGVNTTAGLKPRVYFKRKTDANAYVDNTSATNGWKWKEANGTTTPFDFTIDYSLLYTPPTGVSVGDTVQYFVVAQDLVAPPNVGINSGVFAAQPASVALTATAFPITGTINYYRISPAITGNFTVGTAGNYPSLTGPGGLFADINAKVLTGNIVATIISDLTETGANALNQMLEDPVGSNFTLTIQPDGSTTRTVSGSFAGGLIRLNGADRVTFDGRFGGGGKYLTFTNSGTSGAVFQLISLGNNAGATYNTIRNCNINMGGNASGTYDIAVGGSTVASTGSDNDYLTIQENLIKKTYYGIWIGGNSGNADNNILVKGNIIGSSTTGDELKFCGLNMSYVDNSEVTQNEIFGITQTASFDVIVAGSGVTNTIFRKNKIYNNINNGTNRATAFGVSSGTGSNLTFDNNLIYGITNNGTAGNSFGCYGFYITAGGGYNLYFNSIYMSGDRDAVATTKPTSISAAIYISAGATLNLRNNILENTQTAATNAPKSYAIYSGVANTAFTAINYNDYFVAGAQGVLGFLSADQTTLAAWRIATGQDVNSISADPLFSSTTDLLPQLGSPVLAAGTPIAGIDYDYMNADRSDTNPTMGAYENSGDFAGPAITYSLLGNTTSTANRAFTSVGITDLSGVNTNAGTKPRVYYKRLTDGNVWNDNTSGTDGWKYTEANGASTPFDFTIDYSKLNGGTGVAPGNNVQYFVVAQDLQTTPNVSINSGTFTNQPASVALTAAAFPISGTINSYNISTAYSGTINVGPTLTYTSLTADAADGLFKALNSGVVTGNLTVYITGDLTETGAVALNQLSEEPAGSNFTVTIEPAATTSAPTVTVKTISGQYTGGLIRLNGADRVTFDGRSGGSGSYLAFINTATTGTIATFQLMSLGNNLGATNNTIRNCYISTGFNTTGSYGIVSGGATVATAGSDNDNNTIRNNTISKAYVGIWAQGSTTSNPGLMDNLQILENSIGSATVADYIGHDGIMAGNETGAAISQNTIFNIITSSATPVGITLSAGAVSSVVSRNKIHDITYTGTTGYGGRGMYINTSITSSDLTIDNNLIYVIGGDGYSTFNNSSPVGLYFDGAMGGLKIYFNSVYMSGALTYTAADLSAAILFFTATITNIDLRDNIFMNSMDQVSLTTDKNYAIYSAAPSTSFTNINYNDYFANGPQGILGYLVADITTLSAWRTATGQDANSISADPLFVSTTDLYIPPESPVIGMGTPITGIDYDYDNVDRSNSGPSMGAYEGFIATCPKPTALNVTGITAYSANLAWTIGGSETEWEYTYGLSPLPLPTVPGTATTSNTTNPISGLASNTPYQYYVRAKCGTEFSDWAGPKSFTTLESCPAPTSLTATNITMTSADLGWTAGGTESSWNVEVGLAGFTPGTNTKVAGVVGTQVNPWTASPLVNSTSYDFFVQADCGFTNPKVDNFWMATDETGTLIPGLSSGTFNEPGETGEWLLYDQAPGTMDWYNIWFYDDPVNPNRMKKIRMGFWVQSFNPGQGELYYVVNWSTSNWSNPAFPMPNEEDFIQRSPVNGPVTVLPADPGNSPYGQWIELYFIIPDFNPAWVSVDIWGNNITILNQAISPPDNSPLRNYWQPGMPGGMIVHECLPKPDENTSSWSGPFNFRTQCGPNVLPFTQNFDGVTTPALPYCWDKIVTTTSTGDVVTSTTYNHSSPNSARLYNDNDASATLLLISPEVSASFPMSGNQVNFWARGSAAGYNVTVGVMSDPDNAATFSAVSTITLTAAFAEYLVPLNSYSGSGHYLAFKHATATTYTSVYIDDVTIEKIPTCPKPTSLTSTNVTQTTADISWTAGGAETSWQVKWGFSGFNPATAGTLISGIGLPLPYTLNPPLVSNTAYQWYVRGICGVGDTSLWAGPSSFTTQISPLITFTPLPNTPLTGNCSLDATIIGEGGVPVAGIGLPRVCWKEGKSGTWTYVTGTHVTGNQYNFLFGGGAQGDTIFYFLVAQDNATPTPHVIASPSAGAGEYSVNPPVCGLPPTTPASYRILQSFSGNYYIGSSELYQSLSGTNGFFSALNNGIVTGPIHVYITSNLTETGAVGLNSLNYHIDSFFDVFFEIPLGANRTAIVISGNYAGGLIRLNGADHLTFNGGPGKNLTFRNNSTASSSMVFYLSNGTSWNTIKNCNIGAGSNAVTTSGIYFLSGSGNDHNTIEGNFIFKAYQGIYMDGSSTTDCSYNSVKNNIIGGDVDSLKVKIYGIYATYQTYFEVSGNEIKNLTCSTSPISIGIRIYDCNYTAISKNYIHDLTYTGTGGYGPQGIYLYCDEGVSVNDPHVLVSNNVIRHIAGDSDVPETTSTSIYVPTGIRILGAATITQGINICYNSIYLSPDATNGINYSDNPDWNSALTVDAGPTGINLVNNIFYNNLGRRTGYANVVNSYAIWVKSTTSPFSVIDYNIYYAAAGDNNYVGLSGIVQPPVNNYNLAQWKTFTGQDAHSAWVNPNFQDDYLALAGGSSFAPGGGTPLVGLTESYNGQPRDGSFPTIGAYEYPYLSTWTAGSSSTNWFTAGNWNTPTIPGMNMIVTIPTTPTGGGGIIFPIITTGQTGECKTITVESNANMKIESGGALDVKNP